MASLFHAHRQNTDEQPVRIVAKGQSLHASRPFPRLPAAIVGIVVVTSVVLTQFTDVRFWLGQLTNTQVPVLEVLIQSDGFSPQNIIVQH